ncbi:hypothetical protein Nepgr_006794 [Nepenthes gracilis]|uniref:Uncharacterized protein n=1 Tax=Nepenthes gracilis TaxID=150966 RepID=A0AAD3S5Q5_NEPGR|nr:hypothetical protein Nepgr_006794 [Nepenthes gracilis]
MINSRRSSAELHHQALATISHPKFMDLPQQQPIQVQLHTNQSQGKKQQQNCHPHQHQQVAPRSKGPKFKYAISWTTSGRHYYNSPEKSTSTLDSHLPVQLASKSQTSQHEKTSNMPQKKQKSWAADLQHTPTEAEASS